MQKRLPWLLISRSVVSLSPLPCNVAVGLALLIEIALEVCVCASALEKTKGTVAQAAINAETNWRFMVGTPLGNLGKNLGFTLSVWEQYSSLLE